MTTPGSRVAPALPVASAVSATWADRVRAYVALTKPRIIELLLVTTLPAMLLAARDMPALNAGHLAWLIAITLVGGTLAAGSANAINCYWDRDIDEVMNRTRRRPLPAHAIPPTHALVFGIALGAAACLLLAVLVNVLASGLTLLAIVIYVGVYTIWLKRTTPQNIVIGGAAGALPPVIGWAAVTNDLPATPLVLFLIVFFWTPPHFWALSIRLLRDYAAARVPMLPVVEGIAATNRQIFVYTVILVVLTALLLPVGTMGIIYGAGAGLLGGWFLLETWQLWRDGSPARAIRVYKVSISYLAGLFGVIGLDALLTIRF